MQTTNHPTELRLALVFNGGVSLAVWMAGVTHEIDRLRRAEGPWRDLCRDANATVVVDIIAGTSAGGLNGTLLASCRRRRRAAARPSCATSGSTMPR